MGKIQENAKKETEKDSQTEMSSLEKNRWFHLQKNRSGTIAELMARPRHFRIIRLDENVEVAEILLLYY
jgi:hypothetical protein